MRYSYSVGAVQIKVITGITPYLYSKPFLLLSDQFNYFLGREKSFVYDIIMRLHLILTRQILEASVLLYKCSRQLRNEADSFGWVW